MKCCFLVVKRNVRGDIMFVHSVFEDQTEAEAFVVSANNWYGEDHPLTPLVVSRDTSCRLNPKPFPVMNT